MSSRTPRSRKGVPSREHGETLVAYHDRLSKLAAEALTAGQVKRSQRLQRAAGLLAHQHEEVARSPRTAARRVAGAVLVPREERRVGPGTYPWQQCVDEKTREVGDPQRARQICGRIRANSRQRYGAYWAAREGKRTRNPEAVGKPFIGLGYDGGPGFTEHPRDFVAVVDAEGTVLDLRPVFGEQELRELDAAYPGLPVFGPFRVLASQARDLWRDFIYDQRVQIPSET